MKCLRELHNPWSGHWSNEVQKSRTFFRIIVLPDFAAPSWHSNTFFELANFETAYRHSMETIWRVWESCTTHAGITGPMKFKKAGPFFGWSYSRNLMPLVAIQSLLLSWQTLHWLIDIPWRAYPNEEFERATQPMNGSLVQWSSKNQDLFFRIIVLPDFAAPSCLSNTLIELTNFALAYRHSVKTIWRVWESNTKHGGVNGPMNFKRSGPFFSDNRTPGFCGP